MTMTVGPYGAITIRIKFKPRRVFLSKIARTD